ncbi:MAG: hypothetical protein COW01_05960 [Bdellovibrionales bacterium CG12_big_fil_rev_8_21_14_0_65_38_15]|nr:MAG: hypothetical protein COW79_03855 [Bdellovibrionales bacterium CG22_combo_CG10-13_8_21_14_all_38_13]PIQ55976.1 MAG: hypothetical protein COW01_05960 [Bdellovibrionales bacterium CG12_big_fil_rev_8_21_14_0_65_38_15]PIR30581.1 MAG: hypothetical protein COV38_04500 [Bdellovibrionales bacterium CG11_big_fil_rev_8_21_14_0_20_38_13]
MNKVLTLFILSLIFVSCSGKKREQTRVVYTASLIGGVSFSGSLAIWGSNDRGDQLAIPYGTTSSADTINIPNGNWTFFAIGWEGSNNLEGSTKCAQSTSTLNGGQSTINLTLSSSVCSGSSFSGGSYVSANQFLPLKIIGCYNPGPLSSGQTCDNSNKANISSVKVKIESNTLDSSKTFDPIYSECFDESSVSSGLHTTALTIPTAPGVNFPFSFVVEAYSDTGCVTLSEEIEVKDSMLAFTSTHETYTDTISTELFLISDNQGSAGVASPASMTLITSSPNFDNTPDIQVSGLTSGFNIKFYDDASCTNQIGSAAITTATETFTLSSPLATDGTYTIYSIQENSGVDSVCSSSFVTYVYDSTTPTAPTAVAITTALNNNFPIISVSGLEIGANVELHADASCTSLQASFTAGSTTGSGTISSLADNTYTIYAMQTDTAGNQSLCSTANANFTIDTIAPAQASSVTLSSPATSPGNITTPIINVNFSEGTADVELHTDPTCNSNVASQLGASNPATLTTSTLSEGNYVFYAKIIDPAGNSSCSSAFVAYDVDLTAPSVTGLSNNAGVYQTFNWSWGCTETCSYDYDISQSATPTFPNSFSATTSDSVVSGDGVFYIHVRAQDSAGNISAAQSVTVNIDNTAPAYDNTKIPNFDEILYTSGSSVKAYWQGFTDVNMDTFDVIVYSNPGCSTLVGQPWLVNIILAIHLQHLYQQHLQTVITG